MNRSRPEHFERDSLRSLLSFLAALGLGLYLCGPSRTALGQSANPSRRSPPDFQTDADLHDVFFLDAQTGWVVGDRGVILHTSDGGQNWMPQPTPTDVSLYGIHFVDAQNGWAVGGSGVPRTSRGRGVVLRTDNGGQTWFPEAIRTLPVLRTVRFFDQRKGVAAGDASPLYPAAAFTTNDGGKSWNPFPIRTAFGWTDADFRPSGNGLLLGSGGSVTRTEGAHCQSQTTPKLENGTMRAIAWINDERAIATGDNGRIWLSPDRGNHWHDVSRRIAPDVRVDYHAVTSDGTVILVAGQGGPDVDASGSTLLRSDDGGQSWHTITLPTTIPVARLEMVPGSGDVHAVCGLGQILKSTDRGATWSVIRGGDRRLFALAVFEDLKHVTWPLMAEIGAQYGGRLRILVAGAHVPTPLAISPSGQLHDAALLVGANNGELIRVPNRSDLQTQTIANAVHAWRPDLVIAGGDAHFVKSVTAITQIARPKAAVWQSEDSEWEKMAGALTVSESEIAIAFAASTGMLADTARAMMARSLPQRTPMPRFNHCKPIYNGQIVGQQITNGFPIGGGTPQRRDLTATETNRRDLEYNAQQHLLLRNVIRKAIADPTRASAWLAQAQNMATRLSREDAANVLHDLAEQQFGSGDLQGAFRTLAVIVSRHSGTGVHDAALRNAMLWSSSQEVAYRQLRRKREEVPGNDASTRSGPARLATWSAEDSPKIRPAVRRGTRVPMQQLVQSGPTIADQLEKQAPVVTSADPQFTQSLAARPAAMRLDPADWKSHLGPEHLADPEVQWAVEAHRRRTRQPGVRQVATFKRLSRTLPGDWRDCALAELMILDPQQFQRKPIVSGRFGDRPYLDGRMNGQDKNTWFAATETDENGAHAINLSLFASPEYSPSHENREMPTATAHASPQTHVHLAADEQFLYIAVRCQKVAGIEYTTNGNPRTRDAELARQDRVNLFLDTDRDYCVSWRLTIDHRGWTGEALASDTSWNPTWYVAATSSSTHPEWVGEAAIAWTELAASPPTRENPWALTIQRQSPDGQCWEWPAPPPSGTSHQMETAGLFYFTPR